MYQAPLIFIWSDLRWRVCCWSVPLCEGSQSLEGRGRQGPDETPSGQTLHPANSHPSGSGRSPLINSHQRVLAHQHTLSGLPARRVPRLITDKKRQKQGAPQSFNLPQIPRYRPLYERWLSSLWKCTVGKLDVLLQIQFEFKIK